MTQLITDKKSVLHELEDKKNSLKLTKLSLSAARTIELFYLNSYNIRISSNNMHQALKAYVIKRDPKHIDFLLFSNIQKYEMCTIAHKCLLEKSYLATILLHYNIVIQKKIFSNELLDKLCET